MRGALGLSIEDFHKIIKTFNGAFWKVSFATKVGELFSQI
jgi:hypothetical protein